MQLLAPYTEEIPAYPVQNALTRDIRQAASKQERSEFLSMWAGQAGALGRAMSAEELVRKLVEETEELLGKR
jgi:nitronate monooxygenase